MVSSRQRETRRQRACTSRKTHFKRRRHSLTTLAEARATVLVFIGGSCTTARSYEDRLIGLAVRWHRAGVRLVAINSNNPHLSLPDTVDAMTRRSAMRP